MAPTRARSSSPIPTSPQLLKRIKTAHVPANLTADPTPHFASGLLDADNIQRLRSEYVSSDPFKYAVVDKLFQNDLLKKVKDECLNELSFTEKETDIYKIEQTGDLASLSYLSESQLALFPSLLTLRDALYSVTFRKFLQSVTGCGPLSGRKQDMSVNTYRKGCHLLNHDDVIGSRRVSYILYMPLPESERWQKEWGGALEMYATIQGPGNIPEPEPIPRKLIPPSWNQFVLFEVQPGRSFHAVEEVVVGGPEDRRQRLSISGWFHAAQEGEEGYEPEPVVNDGKSSREQLTSTTTTFFSYPDSEGFLSPTTPLSKEHISFLSEYINPIYFDPKTLKALLSTFVDESSLQLHSFLNTPLANRLDAALRERDTHDGFGETRYGRVPSHHAGLGPGWTVKGPPIRWRYAVLPARDASEPLAPPLAATASLDDILRGLQDQLFPSPAFRAWLAVVTSLLPLKYAAEARRFRPGLDYTLATSDPSDARLDVMLGLTPHIRQEDPDAGSDNESDVELGGWEGGKWGGWECYMAPSEDDDDPAVYRSGTSKNPRDSVNGHHNGRSTSVDTTHATVEDDDEMEGDDNATLLTVQPGFNRLLLVLRDENVMRFVKYVSAAAVGSRWDVCGEYEVGRVEEEED